MVAQVYEETIAEFGAETSKETAGADR
jgi:hypothetical protein